jgi:hypothetical protein
MSFIVIVDELAIIENRYRLENNTTWCLSFAGLDVYYLLVPVPANVRVWYENKNTWCLGGEFFHLLGRT